MTLKILVGVFCVCVFVGCSSSEPTSIMDGVSQSELDDYNALVEAEEKRAKGAIQSE